MKQIESIDMTEALDRRTTRFGPIGAFAARHRVSTFVALTFALSWAVWVPMAVNDIDMGAVFAPFILGVFAPPVAAVFVTWLTGDSVRALVG